MRVGISDIDDRVLMVGDALGMVFHVNLAFRKLCREISVSVCYLTYVDEIQFA